MKPSDRSEPAGGDKRSLIIAQATRLFNEKGYADTRLEDIGDALGTAKTSISYYFKSKQRLLQEAYQNALDFSEQALERANTARTGRMAILGWVRDHAQAHAQALGGARQPIALIADLESLEDEAAAATLIQRYRRLVAGCGTLLQRGRRDGSIGVHSLDATLLFLVNALHWLPRWLTGRHPESALHAIEGLVDLLQHGLASERDRRPAPAIDPVSGEALDSVFDREARNRMKREAFLRTGTRALNARGYRSLSLAEIAGELGVTSGAFYYHIADKDALLRGCFERSCDLMADAQARAIPDAESGLDRLERALRWLYDRQVSNLDPLIQLSLLEALEPGPRAFIESRLSEVRAGFGRMIADAVVDGSARPIDLDGADELVMGSVFADTHGQLSFLPASDALSATNPAISSTAYFETLFHGLAGRQNGATG